MRSEVIYYSFIEMIEPEQDFIRADIGNFCGEVKIFSGKKSSRI